MNNFKEKIAFYKDSINVIGMMFVTFISILIIFYADTPASIGFGLYLPLVKSVIVGICTIIMYYVFEYALKSNGWIVTLIGTICLLYTALDWYFYWKNYK